MVSLSCVRQRTRVLDTRSADAPTDSAQTLPANESTSPPVLCENRGVLDCRMPSGHRDGDNCVITTEHRPTFRRDGAKVNVRKPLKQHHVKRLNGTSVEHDVASGAFHEGDGPQHGHRHWARGKEKLTLSQCTASRSYFLMRPTPTRKHKYTCEVAAHLEGAPFFDTPSLALWPNLWTPPLQ